MPLAQLCAAYAGADSFNSAARGSAVWFHEQDGVVSRVSWQGLSVVRAIQHWVGVPSDGAWGPQTASAIRRWMARMGMDPSEVPDGRITPRAMAAALAVMYTLSSVGTSATAPAARVCVPASARMPAWSDAPPADGDAAASAEVVEGQPSPQRWRRPAESVVIDSGLSEADDTHFVVYRTREGQARIAVLNEDGTLVSDREATADEAAGSGNPNLTRSGPGIDPGSRAPGEPPPAPSSVVGGYSAPPQPKPYGTPLVIAGAVAVVATVGLLVALLTRPPPPPPPPPADPRRVGR